MKYDKDMIPKKRQAELKRDQYTEWKKEALKTFGYFPVFQPFKESFLLRNLSGNALRLYLYLGLMSDNKNGETWVTIDSMASYFGKSNRTISSWIKELEEANLIERFQLELNGPAHTFLTPYHDGWFWDEGSMKKGDFKNRGW